MGILIIKIRQIWDHLIFIMGIPMLIRSNLYIIETAWWWYQMETFSALLAFCVGIHRSPVNSPHKGQWRGALMFFFICAWTNNWANNGNAGDLRRHCAHYDVIVISPLVHSRASEHIKYEYHLCNKVAHLSCCVACAKLWPDCMITRNYSKKIFLQDFNYELINPLWSGS